MALLAVFLLAERRLGEGALVPADVLRNRVFAASSAAVLLMSAIWGLSQRGAGGTHGHS